MLTAQDIMTPKPFTVTPGDDITEAAQILLEKRINGLPVVNDKGLLVGILCQSDLVAQQKSLNLPSVFTLLDGLIPLSLDKDMQREIQRITAITVEQAMTPDPVTVSPNTPIEDVATLMVDQKFHTLPVVDADQLVGVIGKEDILKTLVSEVK